MAGWAQTHAEIAHPSCGLYNHGTMSSTNSSSLQKGAGLSTHTRSSEGPERNNKDDREDVLIGEKIVLPSEVLAHMMECEY